MISQETIQEAIQRLVKAYNPLEIYLFGSYAWGKPDDDSDLNLLVVIESSDEKIYKRGDKAFDALLSLKIPTNIAVFTKQEFDTFTQDQTSLTYEIKNRGKIVYTRDFGESIDNQIQSFRWSNNNRPEQSITGQIR